jgi:hypothetical protein
MGENLAAMLPTHTFPDMFLYTQNKYSSGLFIKPTRTIIQILMLLNSGAVG